jgi:hypothetical protein
MIDKPTYSDYRRWGHGPFVVVAFAIWLLVICAEAWFFL